MKRLSIILPIIGCIMVQTMTLHGMDPALTKRRQEARFRQLIRAQEDLLRRKQRWENIATDLTNRKRQLERQMPVEAISPELRKINEGLAKSRYELGRNKRAFEINVRQIEQIQKLLFGEPVIPPRPHLVPARAEEIEVVLPPTRPVQIEPAQPLPIPIEPVVVRPPRPLPPAPVIPRPQPIPARAEEIEVVLPPTRPVQIEPAQPLPVPIEPVVVRPPRPLPPTPVRPVPPPLRVPPTTRVVEPVEEEELRPAEEWEEGEIQPEIARAIEERLQRERKAQREEAPPAREFTPQEAEALRRILEQRRQALEPEEEEEEES